MKKNSSAEIIWCDESSNLNHKQVMQKFRKENGGMVRKIQTVRIDWPDAIQATNSLIDYISAGLLYRDNRVPVIYHPIRCALNEYTNAMNDNASDLERLSTYLRALLREITASIADIEVKAGDKTIWTPDSGLCLMQAKNQADGEALFIGARPNPVPDQVCATISEAILTNGTKYVLDEVEHYMHRSERLCET